MKWYSYLFEARSLQQYLFIGGKLADMVAASDLIDDLTDSILSNVLMALKLQDAFGCSSGEGQVVHFIRRAGGAFYVVAEGTSGHEALNRLQALWSLTVQQMLPGMIVIQSRGLGQTPYEAIESGIMKLIECRTDQRISFPIAGPFVLRSQRTGKAAVRKDGDEFIDLTLSGHRRYADSCKKQPHPSGLMQRFRPGQDVSWPLNLQLKLKRRTENDFPFKGEDQDIAIIHIDGNGLGNLLQKINQFFKENSSAYMRFFRNFSDGLQRATSRAAQDASEEILLKVMHNENLKCMPARPLVLGGDDLTILVRADLGIPFAEKFIEAFEKRTQEFLGMLRHECDGLPEYLTACAGIAFQKAGQPFMMGYQLAEHLCATSKRYSRKDRSSRSQDIMPSSMSFYRITGTLQDDWESILNNELTIHRSDEAPILLTLEAYAVGQCTTELPKISQLTRLFTDLNDSRSPWNLRKARQLLTLLHTDFDEARRFWEHISEQEKKESSRTQTSDRLAYLKQEMKKLVALCPDEFYSFMYQPDQGVCRSPLADLVTLAAIGFKQSDLSSISGS